MVQRKHKCGLKGKMYLIVIDRGWVNHLSQTSAIYVELVKGFVQTLQEQRHQFGQVVH